VPSRRIRPSLSRLRRGRVASGRGRADALKRWRLERSRAEGVPAYVVFPDRTLAGIVRRRPETLGELAEVSGVGPAKLESYGADVLAELAGAGRPA